MTEEATPTQPAQPTDMTVEIVCAYVAHNAVSAADLPSLIRAVHGTVSALGVPEKAQAPAPAQKPAVAPNKSVFEDYIVCLEDGRKFKSLKRHLQAHYNLSPDEYRAKWGLNRDYPMVARSYSAQRSSLAKTMGLGTRAAANSVAA